MNEKPEHRSDRELREFFSAWPDVRLAYLFGSRARGNPEAGSDYDFGVLLQEDADPDYRYILAHELGTFLDTGDVDVVPLRQAPIELAYNVIAEGRLIFERDLAERVEFEAGLMSRYCDYLPILRQQREDIIREALQ